MFRLETKAEDALSKYLGDGFNKTAMVEDDCVVEVVGGLVKVFLDSVEGDMAGVESFSISIKRIKEEDK